MPTFVHGKSTAVYLDEFDLTSYFTDSSFSIENDTAETTAYGDTNKTYLLGIRGGTLSLSGMWSAGAGGSDEELQEIIGSTTEPIITVREGAAAIGSRAVIAQANETNYSITNPIGDVVTVAADFECTNSDITNLTFALASGVQLTAGASIAHGSLGALSSVDNAASSANGGAATLHVPTNTVNGNTTIKVQHSANDSTWAALISFTAVGSAGVTSEIKAVTGTVNRYLRVTASTAGSSGSITFMVAAARF